MGTIKKKKDMARLTFSANSSRGRREIVDAFMSSFVGDGVIFAASTFRIRIRIWSVIIVN